MTDPIAVDGLQVTLGDHRVLHGVDLRVGPGEVVALLGANGSGKSSAVRAIMGLVRPTAGAVSLFGTASDRFSQWWRIGYVPQRSTAEGGVPATVAEVVGSGRLARRQPFRRATEHNRRAIEHALELVGLGDRAEASITELSGGQQQRVLIARAVAGEPELLVLDEPMAGVDLTSQRIFANALTRFVASGHSLLVVLHETGPLHELIDRVVVLRGGHVVRDTPADAAGVDPLTGLPGVHQHGRTDDHHRPTGADPSADRGLYG